MKRSLPIYINWTHGELIAREKEEISYGGFGIGHINNPIELSRDMVVLDYINVVDSDKNDRGDGGNGDSKVESCADQIMKNLSLYYETREMIKFLIDAATISEMATDEYKVALAAVEEASILKVRKPQFSTSYGDQERQYPTFEDNDDAYWGNELVQKKIDEEVLKDTTERAKEEPNIETLGVIQMEKLDEYFIKESEVSNTCLKLCTIYKKYVRRGKK